MKRVPDGSVLYTPRKACEMYTETALSFEVKNNTGKSSAGAFCNVIVIFNISIKTKYETGYTNGG